MKYAKWIALFLTFIVLCTLTACKKEADFVSSESCFKVGILYPDDPSKSAGKSAMHDAGIRRMCENLGLSENQIIRKINVNDADKSATKAAISACIESGACIIFGTSAGYMEEMEIAANENPDIIFSHYGKQTAALSNMNAYAPRFYEGGLLSGIAAGLKTEQNTIGFIFGTETEKDEIDAFTMGVKAVNPNAKIHLAAFGTESETAQITLGCDVLVQSCTVPVALPSAEAQGENKLSAVLNWGVYYTLCVKDVMEGRWSNVNYLGGINDGLITLSPLSESDGTIMETAQNMILNGELAVFEEKTPENKML